MEPCEHEMKQLLASVSPCPSPSLYKLYAKNDIMCLLIRVFYWCGKYLSSSHFSALRGTSWITVGECEHTYALHGEMLYPTTPSADPDASVGASVGVPQIGSRLVLHFVYGGNIVIIEKFINVFVCVREW